MPQRIHYLYHQRSRDSDRHPDGPQHFVLQTFIIVHSITLIDHGSHVTRVISCDGYNLPNFNFEQFQLIQYFFGNVFGRVRRMQMHHAD